MLTLADTQDGNEQQHVSHVTNNPARTLSHHSHVLLSEDGKIFQLFQLEKIFLPSCCPDVRVALTVVKVGCY